MFNLRQTVRKLYPIKSLKPKRTPKTRRISLSSPMDFTMRFVSSVITIIQVIHTRIVLIVYCQIFNHIFLWKKFGKI